MGSIGRAVPGVAVKIVDEAGKEVPIGEPGEIIHQWCPCDERLFSKTGGDGGRAFATVGYTPAMSAKWKRMALPSFGTA